MLFSGTHFFDSLLENEEYLERYHEYLRQLVEEYVNGGRFDEVYQRIRTQIDPLVEKDPNSSYTYEEYLDAADMLYKTIKLRAESIEGQLNGTIPPTDEGQRQDSSALIDASSIDIDVMGKFSMGNDSDDGFIGLIRPGSGRRPGSSESSDSNTEGSGSDGTEKPEGFSGVPEGFDPNNMPENFSTENMPEGFDSGNMPEGFSMDNMPEGFDPGSMPDMSESGSDSKPDMGSFSASGSDGDSSFPSGDSVPSFSGMPGQSSAGTKLKNLITFGVCFVIMAAALIAAVCYKRRK